MPYQRPKISPSLSLLEHFKSSNFNNLEIPGILQTFHPSPSYYDSVTVVNTTAFTEHFTKAFPDNFGMDD